VGPVFFHTPSRAPDIVGAGMLSLDISICGDPPAGPEFRAGGSCGNVLLILSWLGWHAVPVAHLADDRFSGVLMRDLLRWDVDPSCIRRDRDGRTPLIGIRAGADPSGNPVHRYFWKCPCCGGNFPAFYPLPPGEVREVIAKGFRPAVFYFDRISRSSLALAKWYRDRGATIVFEPQWVRSGELFRSSVAVADILKASREMTKGLIGEAGAGIPLVIETLGPEGIRYRRGKSSGGDGAWHTVPAFPVTGIRDTVGAGDWCTAGIIHYLESHGGLPVQEAPDEVVRDAIRSGQALSALNCKFSGARGAMDALGRKAAASCIAAICRDGDCTVPERPAKRRAGDRAMPALCPGCTKAGKRA